MDGADVLKILIQHSVDRWNFLEGERQKAEERAAAGEGDLTLNKAAEVAYQVQMVERDADFQLFKEKLPLT